MVRLIPIIIIKERRLVKGINFKDHKYFGCPLNIVKIFNEKEVDELIIIDISDKKIDFEFLADVVSESFIPVTYGGSIRNIDEVSALFKIGIEKVSFSNCFFNDLDLIRAVSAKYGAQSVVVTLDFKRAFFGGYKLYDFRKKASQKIRLDEAFSILNSLDICEVLVQSVSHESKFCGVDVNLINLVKQSYKRRYLYTGGIASLDDIRQYFSHYGNSLAVGSFFMMKEAHRAAMISYPGYEFIEDYENN